MKEKLNVRQKKFAEYYAQSGKDADRARKQDIAKIMQNIELMKCEKCGNSKIYVPTKQERYFKIPDCNLDKRCRKSTQSAEQRNTQTGEQRY